MVQGLKKHKKSGATVRDKTSTAKFEKARLNAKKVKKGAPLALPKGSYRNEAVLDRQLSKAIDVANEQKVAAKVVQDGGRLSLNDVMQKGKDLNRENKRSLVKRKIGRVEQKLNILKTQAQEGLD